MITIHPHYQCCRNGITNMIDLEEKGFRKCISHDNISQLLTTVKLYLDICTTDKKGKENLLPNSINLLNKFIDEIRNITNAVIQFYKGKDPERGIR